MVDNKIIGGIFGIIGILLGFGGTTLLTQEQINSAFVCTTNENVAFFERLSSTSKTGYWSDETGDHSSVCKNGQWVKLVDYAKEKGINPETFLYKENQDENTGNPSNSRALRYSCNSVECTPLQ